MPAPGPGVHGYFDNEASWQGAVDEFHVWTRQYALLSAASLLEIYVRSAAIAALWASPELIDKSLKGTDSVALIKFPERIPSYLKKVIETRSENFTKGTWRDRVHSIALELGRIPDEVQSLTKDLQNIQNLRNRVAHSYGMSGELRRTPWQPITAVKIEPSRVIDATKTISSFIRIADKKIFGIHIGGYELMHEFHVWCKSKQNLQQLRVNGTLDSEFRDHIGAAFGRTPGSSYVKSMIAYYDRIT
jgi:hypothetical protein